MIEIPLTGAPKESVDVKIGSARIEFRTSYLNLSNMWTLDLFDRSTSPPTPLVLGVSVVMGIDILKPYRHKLEPKGLGSLFAIPTADPRREAGPGELGTRIKLVHVDPGEVAEIAAS